MTTLTASTTPGPWLLVLAAAVALYAATGALYATRVLRILPAQTAALPILAAAAFALHHLTTHLPLAVPVAALAVADIATTAALARLRHTTRQTTVSEDTGQVAEL